jgi:hypothetical protein
MRFFEVESSPKLDRFVLMLRNQVGRAKSNSSSVDYTWKTVGEIAKASGFEFAADRETFKHIYDSNPAVQKIVKNFNADGIELKVPGVSSKQNAVSGDQETAQDKVDKTASQAAPQQLSKSQQMPKL